MEEDLDSTIKHWKKSRSGAWAGRGFHYQHLVSTLILIRQWTGLAPSGFLVPEGLDDCVIELPNRDIWLQIKSRKDNAFHDTEVQRFSTTIRTKASTAKVVNEIHTAVVLEHSVTNSCEIGIDQIFENKSHSIVVCAKPGEEAVKLLAAHLNTAEVIVDGIVSDIYRLVADASQENASLPFDNRRRISTTEIEHRIYKRLEAEDPSTINLALMSGSLEPIDFFSPVNEPAFYQGVKVIPGHVAAGLVVDRTNDRNSVIQALKQKRQVLIAGPSGAGKSALLWLSAKELSGEFRWYQITPRAVAADADAIIRFIRARHPNETSPIGIAFDEVSSAHNDLWNLLVRELRGLPSVYFLGSIRQEDIALVSNKSDTVFINASLDDQLAETVWQKLYIDQQTKWEHWREPFEQSEGLMLEYLHVLTQGQRLQAVIDEQLRQRQQENRTDELAIIRSTAVICVHGGELKASKLVELLGLELSNANRALSRLLDEHLVRESRPGVLGGLHMLRSRALNRASHDEILFLEANSLWQSLPAVTDETLPNTVHSILTEVQAEDETIALRKLAELLGANNDINIWTGILTGLGLATLERRVISFMEVLTLHSVQRAHWWLASVFSDPSIKIPDLSDFEEWHNIRDAILAFRAMPSEDLRAACLEYLPDGSIVPDCQDLQQANKLLSCLTPICGGDPVQLTIIPNFSTNGEQDIAQVASLLSTAYLIDPNLAKNLVQAFGGEQVLFGWLRSQTPWITSPAVDPKGSHGRTVRSDWYYVAEGEQPDPHETVCNICETLVALSPDSDAAASDAVNPLGHLISIGDFSPWSKNIPRSNLPAKVRVAWNVAFQQILLARSVSDTLTDYTRKMTLLVKCTEKVFRSFTEKWIKGKKITNTVALADEINEITQAVKSLVYATPVKPASEMTVPASNVEKEDNLGSLITSILGNLMIRMSRIAEENAKSAAVFAGSLAQQASYLSRSSIWRAGLEPPISELTALRERLYDVACILHEMAYDGGQSSTQKIIQAARKGRLNKATHAAARHCQSLADQRFHQRLKGLEIALKDKGWNAQCWSRPVDDVDCVDWPAREIAILVEITNFEVDAGYVEDALAVGQSLLENEWKFTIVPVINGKVVVALAILPSSHIPLPDQDFGQNWRDHINLPFLLPEFMDWFNEALAACNQISGILTCRSPINLHPVEGDTFSKSIETFEHNYDKLSEAAEATGFDYFIMACDYLNRVWAQIADEFESSKEGQPVEQPWCMDVHLALEGQLNDQTAELLTVRVLLLQQAALDQ